MMQLKAKCDLWIASEILGKMANLWVWRGKWVNHEFMESNGRRLIHLAKGDTLTFKAIADGDDPYAQLATRYPEWFEVVESVP